MTSIIVFILLFLMKLNAVVIFLQVCGIKRKIHIVKFKHSRIAGIFYVNCLIRSFSTNAHQATDLAHFIHLLLQKYLVLLLNMTWKMEWMNHREKDIKHKPKGDNAGFCCSFTNLGCSDRCYFPKAFVLLKKLTFSSKSSYEPLKWTVKQIGYPGLIWSCLHPITL